MELTLTFMLFCKRIVGSVKPLAVPSVSDAAGVDQKLRYKSGPAAVRTENQLRAFHECSPWNGAEGTGSCGKSRHNLNIGQRPAALRRSHAGHKVERLLTGLEPHQQQMV